MAADEECHHLCKLMAPVRHRWSNNDVIGGIRNTVMPSDCSPTPAMNTEEWKKPNFELRHVFTRTAAHGFHHRICAKRGYHSASEQCICTLLGTAAVSIILTCQKD
ncbi:hypothetical protein ANN_19873 [Periplaneta americana]|uniref:Uncharacterized protein n=1 Tax=Periplaneta americana TaxID=6978 RepID=A0ABQ8SB25_PERAM|nr:hypothetical protein ANN_19873 [Periplaneta americana]